jgi:hypothetical protein
LRCAQASWDRSRLVRETRTRNWANRPARDLVRASSASPTLLLCRSTPALPPSPSAAATGAGSTGAMPAPPFSARPSSSGSDRPSLAPPGPRLLHRHQSPWLSPPGRTPRPRLQVDPHSPPLLARPRPLRRGPLLDGSEEAAGTPAQVRRRAADLSFTFGLRSASGLELASTLWSAIDDRAKTTLRETGTRRAYRARSRE